MLFLFFHFSPLFSNQMETLKSRLAIIFIYFWWRFSSLELYAVANGKIFKTTISMWFFKIFSPVLFNERMIKCWNGRWPWMPLILFSDIDNYYYEHFLDAATVHSFTAYRFSHDEYGRLIGELLRFCIVIFSSRNHFHSFAMVNDIHCQWTSSFFYFHFHFIFIHFLCLSSSSSSHLNPFCALLPFHYHYFPIRLGITLYM